MMIDAICNSCKFQFDGHWTKTGTTLDRLITCPKCLVKGRCSTTNDESNDYDNYSDNGDDDVDTE